MKIAYTVKIIIALFLLNSNIFYCADNNDDDGVLAPETRSASTLQVEKAPDSASMCTRIKRSTLDGILTTIMMDGGAIAEVMKSDLSIGNRLLAIGNVPLTLFISGPAMGMYSFYQGVRYDMHLIPSGKK